MRKSGLKVIIALSLLLGEACIVFATVPAGYYYFAKNKKKAELKTALHTYCSPLKELDYGSGPGMTWEGFFNTDRDADSTVIDMYSNTVRKFTGATAISGMHIEHSFPKSWWGAYNNGAYKDLFHLYPADGQANENKNNLPLGEVTGTPSFDNGMVKIGVNGFGFEYTDKCFEPADEYKGDFARSYFYVATIYEDLAPLLQSPMTYTNNAYPLWKPWAIGLLLKWNANDPVSKKERMRAEAVYNIQGNRNPFIDYPDLANYIWGKDTANVYPFPEETVPFLLTPRRGTTIDFGVVLKNDTRINYLQIQGVNLTSDLQFSFTQNSTALSIGQTTTTSVATATGLSVAIIFQPVISGLTQDTLLISGGGLTESMRIPVKALATSDFITLEPDSITPVSGRLKWITDPLATNYRLNVYQGDQQAGDLIISAYVEGSSWNKAIELYNGTGKTIDLSKYSLQKQANGAGAFGTTYPLSGSLADQSGCVIINKNCTNDALIAKARLFTDSVLRYDGNDAIALVRSGVTIDMVGQANAGASVYWGAEKTLYRQAGVTHPVSVFNPSEWVTYPADDLSLLGHHTMTFSDTISYILKNVFTGKTNCYSLSNLSPGSTYTYSVESMRSGVIAKANTMQLHTSGIDMPVVMESTDVQTNQFTANWEETLYATGYLLNVFKVSGQADTTETEGFASVGSGGTPLPAGWTGTASGTYTSTTSSGAAIPSLQLKNNGEWLQTKTYPCPVSSFSCMYRFASTATGSSLVLYGLSNGVWVKIDSLLYANTSKYYPTYTFSKEQGITAFRFIYHKSSGNMAIDDVSATYGNQDTIFVMKDASVASNRYTVQGLKANTRYFYNVRATIGATVSPLSETIAVKTQTETGLSENENLMLNMRPIDAGIYVSGLQGDELLQIYSPAGVCIAQSKASSTTMYIHLKNKGIYIVSVRNKNYCFTKKVIR